MAFVCLHALQTRTTIFPPAWPDPITFVCLANFFRAKHARRFCLIATCGDVGRDGLRRDVGQSKTRSRTRRAPSSCRNSRSASKMSPVGLSEPATRSRTLPPSSECVDVYKPSHPPLLRHYGGVGGEILTQTLEFLSGPTTDFGKFVGSSVNSTTLRSFPGRRCTNNSTSLLD
jgi:hypothetical protein